MARTRNGLFGKAVAQRIDVGAVLRKDAHDKRLHTSELSQTALGGPGAPLLAMCPVPPCWRCGRCPLAGDVAGAPLLAMWPVPPCWF
jgi:hypothetical protein